MLFSSATTATSATSFVFFFAHESYRSKHLVMRPPLPEGPEWARLGITEYGFIH